MAVAAKNATGTIPIVMWAAGDPVELGLIASLARPGGNVTGLSFTVGAETNGKRLELLKETVPKIRLVAVLSNPANPSHAVVIGEVKVAARSLGVQLQLLEVRGPSELDGAFAAMVKERVQGLVVVTDTVFLLHRERLARLAAKNRLPSMHGLGYYVEAGGLMSYGPSGPDLLRRAAGFVDKILKGAKPATSLSSNRSRWSLSSTSRPPRPSASRSRHRSCSAQIRSLNDASTGASGRREEGS